MADENNTNPLTNGSLFNDNRAQPSRSTTNQSSNEFKDAIDRLDDILKALNKFSDNYSQSRAQDEAKDKKAKYKKSSRSNDDIDWKSAKVEVQDKVEKSVGSFADGIDQALEDALGVTDFKKTIKTSLSDASSRLGVELKDLPNELGKQLTKASLDAFKQTYIGKNITDKYKQNLEKYSKLASEQMAEAIESIASFKDQNVANATKQKFSPDADTSFKDKSQSFADAVSSAADVASTVSDVADAAKSFKSKGKAVNEGTKAAKTAGAAAGGAAAGASAKAATKAAASVGEKAVLGAAGGFGRAAASAALGVLGGPGGLLLTAGIEVVTDTIGKMFNKYIVPIGESFSSLMDGLSASADREMTSRSKRIENGNKRLQQDIQEIIKQPFVTLEKAAEKVEQVWDANLRVINQTQGYTKADLQDLMSSYSSRLKSEGLDSVVDSASITENLTKVLQSGLQGQAAEEFSYLATKLNAAIPTEDFFGYASTYSELAANAVKNGMSQTQAIDYANKQLELFASDLAYASRNLTGGFATGLKSASDIFEKAVQISVAAKTDNPSQLAGTLTSVSAVVGSIAPDLASSLVDAVYNAAVGGNSSEIVALRSLAGINASNTEFLQAIAKNPQSVFEDLFKRLGDLQTMSSSNYMEVAEGLSKVFGLSADAFSRVDFNYLAKQIANMNVSNSALNENMTQLKSGQSTTSADQMRIQQINKYMIDEGLSYVLDNEAARAVQQHMWDEQLANEMQEATYGVELRGKAMTLFGTVVNSLQGILNFLSGGLYSTITQVIPTIQEALTADDRVRQVLEEGNIGNSNKKILTQLTTYGKKLNLTNTYLSMLQSINKDSGANYSWGTVSKSTYAKVGTKSTGAKVQASQSLVDANESKQQTTTRRLTELVQSMLSQSKISSYFDSTIDKTVKKEIEKETDRLANKAVSKITDKQVKARAKEYLDNPEQYGIGNVAYTSRLAKASKASGLKGFSKQVDKRNEQIAEDKVRRDMLDQAKKDAATQARQNILTKAANGAYGYSGYNAWYQDLTDAASKLGISSSDLEGQLSDAGYTLSDFQNYFQSMQVQQAAIEKDNRDTAEETFWSETQRLLTILNSNVYDVLDKGDLMGIMWPGLDSWLSDIDSTGTSGGKTAGGTGFRGEMNEWFNKLDTDVNSFHDEMISQFKAFRKDWTDYYINHTTYTKHLTGESDGKTLLKQLKKVENKRNKNTEDVINALTDALNNNKIGDLLDPTVQTNVFLSAILQGVQTLIQQNNTTGTLQIPDALQALATGYQPTTQTTNAKSTKSKSKSKKKK